MNSHNLLGIVLPTNNPEAMRKYFLPSLVNAKEIAPYVTFLLNFQKPYTQEESEEVIKAITDLGFKCKVMYSSHTISAPGLVPINLIREETSSLAPDCKYFMIFDDDMSFMGPSTSMHRNAGVQILECLIYLLSYRKCGVLVCGGTLVKKIKKDTISPIDYCREYVTGKGLILKNVRGEGQGNFVPWSAIGLYGSDEEKVAAAYRISQGYFVAEIPFMRINHYENQRSSRNKKGKIPGKDLYQWNTDEIKDNNNFKFIRENYCSEYTPGKGNIVSKELYENAGGVNAWKSPERYTMDFNNVSTEEIITTLDKLIHKEEKLS